MKIEELKARFTSGNSVPVDRAYITAEEFAKILELFECAQHQVQHHPINTVFGLIDAVQDLEQS